MTSLLVFYRLLQIGQMLIHMINGYLIGLMRSGLAYNGMEGACYRLQK